MHRTAYMLDKHLAAERLPIQLYLLLYDGVYSVLGTFALCVWVPGLILIP